MLIAATQISGVSPQAVSRRAFPDATFGLDDPVQTSSSPALHNDPVGVIEADRAARFQVVHPELRTRLTLLGGAEGCKAQDVGRLLVQELGEASLEIVVGRDVVEDGLLRLEGRKVSACTEIVDSWDFGRCLALKSGLPLSWCSVVGMRDAASPSCH
jgi:hypothetical protein